MPALHGHAQALGNVTGQQGLAGAGLALDQQGALQGDPFTPLLRAYRGDKVLLRVQVGQQEEGHNFNMNGVRWLQSWASPNSGFRNTQMAGISEYFLLKLPETAPVILQRLGIPEALAAARLPDDAARWGVLAPGTATSKGAPLFPRIESDA